VKPTKKLLLLIWPQCPIPSFPKAFQLTQVESTPPAGTMELLSTHGPKQRAALMKRNSKYVGLDVYQAMTAATVRTEGGRVIARSVIETSERSITEFFSAMRGTVHVAFEEGTQAQWLYDLWPAPHSLSQVD